MLMLRDLSQAVHVDGEDAVFVSLVLDIATGLARGVGTGSTAGQARTAALMSALSAGEDPPARVVCDLGMGDELSGELKQLMPAAPVEVVEAYLPDEAEDIFDELVGHLAGRGRPEEQPAAEDWELLVEWTEAYAEEEPWLAWPDELLPRLVLTVDGDATSYIVSVIGQQGLQAGLVLYPGDDHSDVVVPGDDWEPDDPLPFAPGTLLLHLNPPADTLADMAAKAIRYGWPEQATRMPVWLAAGPDGFADLDATGAHHLTLACEATLTHARKLSAAKTRRVLTTSGTLDLAGGRKGAYRLSPAS
jgi:hypothetical protein